MSLPPEPPRFKDFLRGTPDALKTLNEPLEVIWAALLGLEQRLEVLEGIQADSEMLAEHHSMDRDELGEAARRIISHLNPRV